MTSIEKQIANEIAKANGVNIIKLGLRFDKVVVRLLGHIRMVIEQDVPKDITVLITITAPIKHPAKTAHELIGNIKDLLKPPIQKCNNELVIFQNEIQIRIVEFTSKPTVKIVGLVHNPDIDPGFLLDLASKWLSNSTNS